MPPPPRSLAQRLADARARLEQDEDAWVASGGERSWMVPLTFLWIDGELLIATDADTVTGRNVTVSPDVRIGVGPTRDVVMIDGHARIEPISTMTTAEADAYLAKCAGSDPRTWADSLIRVRPVRVQAWRESNELAGRTLMRAGRWLDA